VNSLYGSCACLFLSNSGAVSEQAFVVLLLTLYFATLMNVPIYQLTMVHSDGFWGVEVIR
jgi:hypothetical protein